MQQDYNTAQFIGIAIAGIVNAVVGSAHLVNCDQDTAGAVAASILFFIAGLAAGVLLQYAR